MREHPRTRLSILIGDETSDGTLLQYIQQIRRHDYATTGTLSAVHRNSILIVRAISFRPVLSFVLSYSAFVRSSPAEISHHKSRGLQSIDSRRLQLVLGPRGPRNFVSAGWYRKMKRTSCIIQILLPPSRRGRPVFAYNTSWERTGRARSRRRYPLICPPHASRDQKLFTSR